MNDVMVRVLTWAEAVEAGAAVCGGKGYNLGRLARYGFAVPRGGVVPASWYDAVMARVPSDALDAVAEASAEMATHPAIVSALERIRQAIETCDLFASTAPDGSAAKGEAARGDEPIDTPGAAAGALRRLLHATGLASQPIAVRSSATAEDSARASFAGIHRSVLNVTGANAVARALLHTYASLWTPQALAYRRRMGFTDRELRCAGVLCEMVRAEGRGEPVSAGVAFTYDPLTGRRDLIVVDAVPGLGEAAVSGAVNPQRLVFRVHKGRVQLEPALSGDPRARAALIPADRERDLAEQLLRLHWALGDGQDPQDAEWAFDGRTFWLLQARPATYVRRVALPIDRPEAVAARGGRRIPRYWSTANIKDAVPGVVSMLSWSMISNITQALAFAVAVGTGYALTPGVELTRRFRGRAYFDLTFMQWTMYDALGVTTAEFAAAIGGHQPEIPLPPHPLKGPDGRRRTRARLRLLRRLWRIDRELEQRLRSQEALLGPWRTRDLTALPAQALGAMIDAVTREHDRLDETVGLVNSAEGPWEQVAEALMKPIFGDETRALLGRLLAGTGAVTSAEHGYAIVALADAARADPVALAWLTGSPAPPRTTPVSNGRHDAAPRDGAEAAATSPDAAVAPMASWRDLPSSSPFRQALTRFLDEYGHRAVYEADLLNPRWAEDPTYILDQVRHVLANPGAPRPRAAARRVREAAERELRWKAGWRRPIILWFVGRLRGAMALRERAKSALVASLLPMKRLFLETGRRLVAAGHLDEPHQVLHLSTADLTCLMNGSWDGTGARELAIDRARQREQWLAEPEPPDVLVDEEDSRAPAASPASREATMASAPDDAGRTDTGTRDTATSDAGPSDTGRSDSGWQDRNLRDSGRSGDPGDQSDRSHRNRIHRNRNGHRWTGIAASPGRARGRARVVRHPNDAGALASGDILVAPSTDPGWTPLFLRAAAIVMEVGGYLSHGAIVAREYGIPAVVNLPGVLDELREGEELQVDGDAGVVTRVEARDANADRRG